MRIKIWITVLLITFAISSCQLKDDTTNPVETVPTDQTVKISGQVVDHVTSKPIDNATVNIEGISSANTVTDNNGNYNFSLTITNTTNLSIISAKDSYEPDTTSLNVAPGKSFTAPTLRLIQKSGDLPIISDKAASIYLFSQSTDKLGIKSSGDIETAIATFQVIDSSGIPINSTRAVNVEFKIIAGPNGGEFLYPNKIKTNELGQATTAITSGTKAGVVQIEADIVKDNITIRSKPIFFTIYGGFPVPERFSVASEKLNSPYWALMNKEIVFTALLGDQYSNPVRPNTAVYFSTTEGVIGNFKYTDNLGRATSTLATFGFPNDPDFGPGFFVVSATTSTEDGQQITTKTRRLLSYQPIISNVSPNTFKILNGGSQSFTFTVKDFNGNPVSSDNTIGFELQGGDMTASPASINIPDALTGGPGITEFTVTIGDANIQEIKPSNASLVITVNGPFGTFSYTINGTTE